jgi:hypothetical protein
VGDQLGGEPREQLFQGLLPARQQRMDVASVRDATSCMGVSGSWSRSITVTCP